MWQPAILRPQVWRSANVRHVLAGRVGLFLVAAALALAACGTPPPDAATVLRNASAKFDQTTTFHFILTAAHLGPNDALGVTYATGDVQRPDKLMATANANVGGLSLTVKLIVIGQQQWFDPGFGSYQPTTQFGSFLTIFDAQQGVGTVLVHMQQPSTAQDSSAGNTPCWKISGKVDTAQLAAIVGGSALTGQTVQTSVCVGKSDNELYTVRLAGAVTQTDTAQTTRTFTLSNFDKPVTIEPPSTPTS
jgi:LppX_LprAFG lipoprotein